MQATLFSKPLASKFPVALDPLSPGQEPTSSNDKKLREEKLKEREREKETERRNSRFHISPSSQENYVWGSGGKRET